MLWSAAPLPSPMRSVRAPTRTLSRRGRVKPRTHVTVRRSRLFVGFARYTHSFRRCKGLSENYAGMRSGRPSQPRTPICPILVARGQTEREGPRRAVISGADATNARELLRIGL